MKTRRRDRKPGPAAGAMDAMKTDHAVHPAPGAPGVKPLYSWLAAVLGAVAGALAYDPVAWRWLIPLAPLGCFLAIRWAPTMRGAVLRAYAFGWLFYFGTLSWLLTICVYAPAVWIGVMGVVGLGLYLAVYPALLAWFVRRWMGGLPALWQFIGFSCLWIIFEWFRTLGRLSLPLGQLGHAWAVWWPVIQIAEYLGELGVSLEVFFISGLIFYWGNRIYNKNAPPGGSFGRRWGVPVLFLLLPFVVFAWGIVRPFMIGGNYYKSLPGFSVALIQPNIPQPEKWKSYADDTPDEERQRLFREINTTNVDLLDSLKKPCDFALLPETAFVGLDLVHGEDTRSQVGQLIKAAGVDTLFGSDRMVSFDPTFEGYNSAWFVHRDGTFDANVYDKMRLVPFGEHVPYFGKIPGLKDLIGIGSFNEGQKQVVFQTTGGYKFGTLICFESTFSSLARGLAQKGAQFITVITNDAWYGLSAGAAQHHHVSLLRAVETRRWVLRAANTGISSIIAPTGQAIESLPSGQRGVIQYTIPYGFDKSAPLTLFTRIGNSWLIAPMFVIALLIIWKTRREKRRDGGVKISSASDAPDAAPLA